MSWFCKHEYKVVMTWDCKVTGGGHDDYACPIDFLVCEKCGKRELSREPDHYYNKSVLRRARLWEDGKLSLEEVKELVE